MAVTGMHPLAGKRVVVTRAHSLGQSFQHRLHHIGAIPVSIPAIEIAPAWSLPPGGLLSDLAWCNWLILPSPSVIALWANTSQLRAAIGTETQIATLGQSSAQAYEARTGLRPSFVYDWSQSGSLAVQLGLGPTDRLLVMGSSQGPGPTLTELLARHANSRFRPVIRISCSRTLARDLQRLAHGFDAITFTSASGVHCFMQASQGQRGRDHGADGVCWACIGRSTAAALAEYGTVAQVICQNPSEMDMIADMNDWFAQQCIFPVGDGNA